MSSKRIAELRGLLNAVIERTEDKESSEYLSRALDIVSSEKLEWRDTAALSYTISEMESSDGDDDNEITSWLKSNFLEPTSNIAAAERSPMEKFLSAARKAIMRQRTIRMFRAKSAGDADPVEKQDQVVMSLSDAAQSCLAKIDSWSFDIFEFNEAMSGNVLVGITMHLFEKLNLSGMFEIPLSLVFSVFEEVQKGYNNVPYHNCIHAADVVANTYYFSKVQTPIVAINDFDLLCILVAAAIHDFRHPGVNNQFLINTNDDIALRYNDYAVLENYHVAEAFRLFKDPKFNLFRSLSASQFQEARAKIIDMVLATNMSQHMDGCKAAIDALNGSGKGPQKKTAETTQIFLDMIIHAADLSNPCKPRDIMKKWTHMCMEEFFYQGDMEKKNGLDISPMMNRDTANIPRSQVGFIDYVIKPLFDIVVRVTPGITTVLDVLKENRNHWAEQV